MFQALRLIRVLIITFLWKGSWSLPSGFIVEDVTRVTAITGAFAWHKSNEAVLFLSSKEGSLVVMKNPDDSDDYSLVADFKSWMCEDGERGLQSIRPHPNFVQNRYLYAYYTRHREGCDEDPKDGPYNRLSRFTVSKDFRIDRSSERVLLELPPTSKHVHNGGSIAFGNDGKLYLTTGDGGSREPAVSQDLGNLLGKILRLNDDGTVPNDNPYAKDGKRCGNSGGKISKGTCSEIFASGFRNPFRLTMDPNTQNKVKFHVGDVGASTWEEISVGGADFPAANYGWPKREGPCKIGSNTECSTDGSYKDPLYYYQHTKAEEGGSVTGNVFVPSNIWPSQYKYLFIDFVFGKIYNLIHDAARECRDCVPPVPAYRNETFYEHGEMVDMFFGPFKDTQALYLVSRSSSGNNVRRIRYTSTSNRSPVAGIKVSDMITDVGTDVKFDGSKSSDPDGDKLNYRWDFGDGSSKSTQSKATHSYKARGKYTVELRVTDSKGLNSEAFVDIMVGKPPKVRITSPAQGDKFFVGEVLHLTGSATDGSSGKALSNSQLVWEVHQHHATHFHPFLDSTPGNNLTLQPAPAPEDFLAATNSYLGIILTAIDSDGLTTTVSRDIYPRKVNVKFQSDPPETGRFTIFVDEFPLTTPATIVTWENHELRLSVNDQPPYVFKSWSDGGSRSHTLKIPRKNSTKISRTVRFVMQGNTGGKVPPLIRTVRDCSSKNPCRQCEGHCQRDNECQGSLMCFKKGGPGKSVPGCVGIDTSNTDWCTKAKDTTPALNPTIRDCSSKNPCRQCEGHCQRDNECQGSLICFKKGGPGKSVPGCVGIDKSNTDWCTKAKEPEGGKSPPFNPTVRNCSSKNPCLQCEGHCQTDNECKGSLICFKKSGPGKSVPGCLGIDNSNTDWCTAKNN